MPDPVHLTLSSARIFRQETFILSLKDFVFLLLFFKVRIVHLENIDFFGDR